jgi:hypothetical protein
LRTLFTCVIAVENSLNDWIFNVKIMTLAALSVFATIVAQPVSAGFSCDVQNYSHGLGGAKGNRAKALKIIESWIPRELIINKESIQFSNNTPIEIDSYTDQKIRASYKTKDESGKKHQVVYEIVFRQNAELANVTVRQKKYAPLGPVIFTCVEF